MCCCHSTSIKGHCYGFFDDGRPWAAVALSSTLSYSFGSRMVDHGRTTLEIFFTEAVFLNNLQGMSVTLMP